MAAYALTQYTAPTAEPLDLSEVKAHLRILHNDEDQRLRSLIIAARNDAELATARQLITATWELRLDRWPCGLEPIYLPLGKLQSVTSVKYLDADGNEQTLSTSAYRVGSYREPAEITLAYQQSWPALRGVRDQITIRYVCGYGAASAVPQALKEAMLIDIARRYEMREELPLAAESVYRQYSLGDEFHCYEGR